ncbi:kinase 4 [Nesidiocoris tenuis]|uniref:Kinase 4 n=1 Tax=Nesidiocoris tenuis TaxID=355587 RepID=A0ABN7AZM9_9HEMI|nr:kinase 4 [Nesidiocoris tenuis]
MVPEAHDVPESADDRNSMFDEDPLVSSSEHYVALGRIGNGAYGTVYKARSTHDGAIVALKKIRIHLTEDGFPTSTLREIATLKQIDQFEHPNIIRLLDICHGQGLNEQLMLYLVFEHIDQDMASYMERHKPPNAGIPKHTVKNFMHQIFYAIDFLHSHRIMHRDLKPQNILITNNGVVKLADFGLAKTYCFYMRLTSTVVTLWYRSPEVLLTCPYSASVDIWSAGCIMAEMMKGSPMFTGKSEGDQLDRIFRVIGTPGPGEWPPEVSLPLTSFKVRAPTPLEHVIPDLCREGRDLLSKILVFSPTQRLTSGELLDHPYFDDSSYMLPSFMGSQESINLDHSGSRELILS